MSNISEKVEKFADYFANIAMKLKSSAIPMMNFVWRYNLIRNLKRNISCSADELPPNMLKDCICSCDYSIFNTCYQLVYSD